MEATQLPSAIPATVQTTITPTIQAIDKSTRAKQKKRHTDHGVTNGTHLNGTPLNGTQINGTPVQREAEISIDSIWRTTVAQYHAMLEAGILADGDPLELLEGWLVQKMAKKPTHRIATRAVRKTLESLIPEGWYVEAQEPITLTDSEPEPDVTVIRGDSDNFSDHHPNGQMVGLVVEVSDTTLKRDQGIKKRIYARAEIPIYWLINIPENQIEVYSTPTFQENQHDYQQKRVYTVVDTLPFVLDGLELGRIDVQTLLP